MQEGAHSKGLVGIEQSADFLTNEKLTYSKVLDEFSNFYEENNYLENLLKIQKNECDLF